MDSFEIEMKMAMEDENDESASVEKGFIEYDAVPLENTLQHVSMSKTSWSENSYIQRQKRCALAIVMLLLISSALYVVNGVYSTQNGDAVLGADILDQEGVVSDISNTLENDQRPDSTTTFYDDDDDDDVDSVPSSSIPTSGGGTGIMVDPSQIQNNDDILQDMEEHHDFHNTNFTEEEPSTSTNNEDVDVVTDLCDHSEYQDWLDATVSIQDGLKYEIVEQFQHDSNAFVQGLTYANGMLWESNGMYSKSTVRILDENTADVIKSVDMDPKLFAEGMTIWKDKLYQITWKSKRGFIYDAMTLETLDEFTYNTTRGEGWGITYDPCQQEFVVTDGSPNLHFWDPETLQETHKIAVTRLSGKPAKELNEIEWYRGRIIANVWYEDTILVINPSTGMVEKEYDFSLLFPKIQRKQLGCDVLNGISVSSDPSILYFTGKYWDRIFKIRLLV